MVWDWNLNYHTVEILPSTIYGEKKVSTYQQLMNKYADTKTKPLFHVIKSFVRYKLMVRVNY